MMPIIFISVALIFFIVFAIFCKKLIKKLELPEIEWHNQKELPTEIRIGRNISKDVLVFDNDTKKIYIGYFSFSNDMWVVDNKIKSVEQPTNFVWAYLD